MFHKWIRSTPHFTVKNASDARNGLLRTLGTAMFSRPKNSSFGCATYANGKFMNVALATKRSHYLRTSSDTCFPYTAETRNPSLALIAQKHTIGRTIFGDICESARRAWMECRILTLVDPSDTLWAMEVIWNIMGLVRLIGFRLVDLIYLLRFAPCAKPRYDHVQLLRPSGRSNQPRLTAW